MLKGNNDAQSARNDFVFWLGLVGRKFRSLIRNSTLVFAFIASLAIVVMALIGGADVVGTKVLNIPVPGTFEITENLMVVLVFGGLAYAQVLKRHVRVEFLLRLLPPKGRVLLELLGLLIGDVYFTLLTWRCYLLFLESWLGRELGPSVIGFPIYPSKFLMLLGSGLMTLQLLIDTFEEVRALWDTFSSPTNKKLSK
jgi:TRAP-type C4-dicarboxylate transport system permease small subunit